MRGIECRAINAHTIYMKKQRGERREEKKREKEREERQREERKREEKEKEEEQERREREEGQENERKIKEEEERRKRVETEREREREGKMRAAAERARKRQRSRTETTSNGIRSSVETRARTSQQANVEPPVRMEVTVNGTYVPTVVDDYPCAPGAGWSLPRTMRPGRTTEMRSGRACTTARSRNSGWCAI